MSELRYDFASDNAAPAMPEVMQAMLDANHGAMAGYGSDGISSRAADLIRERFDADADVRFLASGTAANALALAMLVAPHEAVLAHDHAHILTDETGAPGYFGAGLGLIGLPGGSGRIALPGFLAALGGADDAHHQSPAALSLTNATEYGSCYSDAVFAQLVNAAKSAGLRVHLDGARLANAAAAGFDLKAVPRLGVDVVVLGGTKAGSTPSEALVVFDRGLARRLDARLKHAGQLVSKGRFLAAPWIGLLDNDAWIAGAKHANAMAKLLASQMPFTIRHPVDVNGVFVEMGDHAYAALIGRGWRVYRFLDGSVRFMCSWASQAGDIEALSNDLRKISDCFGET